jgi:formyl-CoA transferase
LYEAVFAVMESLIPEYAALGHIRERNGSSLAGISPSNTYPCGDGQYVVIAGNSDSIFKRLMLAIGRPDLAEDQALARNDGRVQQNDMLDKAIGNWTAERPLADVLAVMASANVPSGSVYTAADIAKDPHYHARGMIETETLPDGTAIDLPGIVPKLSGSPGKTSWVGPQLGAHTDEVLQSLGIGAEHINHLRATGVIL